VSIKKLKSMSIKGKLSVLIIVLLITSIFTIALITSLQSKSALEELSINQLMSIREIIKERIFEHFENIKTFGKRITRNRFLDSMHMMAAAAYNTKSYKYGKDQEIHSDLYDTIHKKFSPLLRGLANDFKFSDIFLVSLDGQIVLSSALKKDERFLGLNLLQKKYDNDVLSQCFKKAKVSKNISIFFSDYQYDKKLRKTVAFVCGKHFSTLDYLDEFVTKGDPLGITIARLDLTAINKIASARTGMGETGQSFLVGPDRKLRSNFYNNELLYNINVAFKNNQILNSLSANLGLNNKFGWMYTVDVESKDVLSVYSDVIIFGENWAIISEKRTSEIFTPIYLMLQKVFIVSIFISIIAIAFGFFIMGDLIKMFIEKSQLAGIGQLTGNVAHQISNPLTIILGSAKIIKREMSKKKIENDKISLMLGKIAHHGESVTNLIEKMRILSRDKKQIIKEETTAERLITDVIELASVKLAKAEIPLIYKVSEKSFPVKVDIVLIESMIVNLFNNAIDYLIDEMSPFEKRFLKIELLERSGNVHIRIIDAGKGIPLKLQDQIFQPLFTTKDTSKGTGLGLSLARTTIEQNGGELYLDEKCKNTCFVVSLPLFKKKDI